MELTTDSRSNFQRFVHTSCARLAVAPISGASADIRAGKVSRDQSRGTRYYIPLPSAKPDIPLPYTLIQADTCLPAALPMKMRNTSYRIAFHSPTNLTDATKKCSPDFVIGSSRLTTYTTQNQSTALLIKSFDRSKLAQKSLSSVANHTSRSPRPPDAPKMSTQPAELSTSTSIKNILTWLD